MGTRLVVKYLCTHNLQGLKKSKYLRFKILQETNMYNTMAGLADVIVPYFFNFRMF
jgi:hypothetical protein